MIDPLAEAVALLRPGAPWSKRVAAAGPWCVRRSEAGQPFWCAVLAGSCWLAVEGHGAVALAAGDFVLIPAAHRFRMGGPDAAALDDAAPAPPVLRRGELRHGRATGPAGVRFLVGYCSFGSPDAALLLPLLPQWVHVRGDRRLAALVQLVGDEARSARPARDLVLARLLEVLLIEALRAAPAGAAAAPGLLRGLGDPRLAVALRRLHAQPAHAWTVDALAREAALSRSVFFERFHHAVGMAPMAYLLGWRMALAKTWLRGTPRPGVADVAARAGYGSAAAFSTAFARHTGMPPVRYASVAGH